jgi:hypothetical protein
VVAGAASDHRAPSPAETTRRQQEVPAAPGISKAPRTLNLSSPSLNALQYYNFLI